MLSSSILNNELMKKYTYKDEGEEGFTLIEVLVVIGIIAILSGIVLVAINPNRQFKIARDSERQANITAILNAVGQNTTDHSGTFACLGVQTVFPQIRTKIASGVGSSTLDLAPCLVPDYLPVLPYDPSKAGSHYTGTSSYDTGYFISSDANSRITVSADGEMSTATLSIIR